MDITCGDCGARFRLDPALLKDSSAARLRCRKCGGLIVVRLHEESPVPVPPPQETIPPSTVEPAAPAQEPVSPWPVEPAAPLAATGLTSSVPHTAPAGEPEPAQPGTVYSRLEDLFVSPAMEAGTDRIPPPPEEQPAGEYPPEETTATEPERKVPSRRAPSMLAVLVISVLWILLLAGAALYFGTTKSGQDLLGKLFAGWGSSRTGSSPARPVYDIRDVKWYVDKSSAGGSLFVIKGVVANVGNAPSAGIRIQATLLGKDNEALAEKTAFAGNVNREIPPGKALPFVVIFFHPPVEIAAVMVKAIDAR